MKLINMEDDEHKFAIINNIPSFYHSSDLRNFFSQFIESGAFECFHFRHRPESKEVKHASEDCEPVSVSGGSTTDVGSTIEGSVPLKAEQPSDRDWNGRKQCTAMEDDGFKQLLLGNSIKKERQTCCCVVKLKSDKKYTELQKLYHKRHWLDKNDARINSCCSIQKIKLTSNVESENSKYKTRKERQKIAANRETFTREHLQKLLELNPPINVMPNGNVGTPTMTFLILIQQCKLPPSIINKLGLSFPKTRSNRRYGNVPLQYDSDAHQETRYKSLNRNKSRASLDDKNITIEAEESEEDVDDCEEWERHEALMDDPTCVERNKERLFEEEIELKWEKGGSGLVFYTDAQYWKEQEGDFDEQTADDWDVDMSIYYEENGGDKDARDYIMMRREQRLRNGEEESDMRTAGFMKTNLKLKGQQNLKKPKNLTAENRPQNNRIGNFEQHTKGIGRKVLEKQGWKDGEGLGHSVKGISGALDNEGQTAKDKTGFGYHGVKLNRGKIENKYSAAGTSSSSCDASYIQIRKVEKTDKPVIISTAYDDVGKTDPKESLLRRNHHYHIKYRNGIDFQRANEMEFPINQDI